LVKKGGTKDEKICQKKEMWRKRERDGTERDIPRKEREIDNGEDVKAREGERQKDEKGREITNRV